MEKFKFKSPVLEVGCGTGETLQAISKYGAKGVDISSEAISICKTKGLNVQKADLLDVKDTFNSVICVDVIEHIKDDRVFTNHLYEVLNHKGKIFIMVPSGKMMKDDLFYGHYRRYSKDSIIKLLKKSNFIIKSIEMFGYPILCYTRLFMNFIYKLEPGKNRDLKTQTLKSSFANPFDKSIYAKILRIPLMSKLLFRILLLQNFFANGDKGFGVIVVAEKP